MSTPLAYLILPHDVCRGLEDGAMAACWALQASNVLDVSGNLADALRAAEACSWRTGAAVSILAVTVAGTMDVGARPAEPATCVVCHGAGYLTTRRGKRRPRPWPRCLACDGAGAHTPAGRE